jgi:hypothetical protein
MTTHIESIEKKISETAARLLRKFETDINCFCIEVFNRFSHIPLREFRIEQHEVNFEDKVLIQKKIKIFHKDTLLAERIFKIKL